jgi:hypothetical protein
LRINLDMNLDMKKPRGLFRAFLFDFHPLDSERSEYLSSPLVDI